MKKVLIGVVFTIIISIAGLIGKDWYDTYQLTQEGATVDDISELPLIGEITPVERISATKKLKIDVQDYQKLLVALENIKKLPKYKFNVDKNIKQNIIVKPTIFDYINTDKR